VSGLHHTRSAGRKAYEGIVVSGIMLAVAAVLIAIVRRLI
jgi:hypothetical protein